ncbi:hypothetical protein SALWKB12_0222 [Snodgrassella communis]|uniref:Uncharacterized protein n=1 Tax=Snodgrassella communis TaxID=2946699 RepID=A0A836MRD6_9NEIS|nr:hypothetical protein SALWKB12_0222 [Snodgrassella communis]KDN15661.1 hypothetical protein SALWKB29_0080 [Snodgrassella communis]
MGLTKYQYNVVKLVESKGKLPDNVMFSRDAALRIYDRK